MNSTGRFQDLLTEYSDEEWAEREKELKDLESKKSYEERKTSWTKTKEMCLRKGLSLRHLEELFLWQVKDTPALDAIAKLDGDGLYILAGNVGCGKTFAAHAWLLGAMHQKANEWSAKSIYMMTSAKFSRLSRYNDEVNKFDLLERPDKLVIDDMGVEYADEKGSFLVDFDELLDIRWRSRRPTIVTTNLSREQFKKRYGLRIYDRARGSDRWLDSTHISMRG